MAEEVEAHGRRTCAVEVSPGDVDAGADLTLKIRVSCPRGDDLTGQRVSVRDQDDKELASAELAEPDDDDDEDAYVADGIVLKAPRRAGERTYRVVLLALEMDRISHEETSTEFSFVVRAHAARLNVWGLPSAIVAGERFKLKVGLKCSAGCKLADKGLTVVDHEGAEIATAALLDDPWPGTSALYFAEAEAEAPGTAGDYKWEVKSAEWEPEPESVSEFPHAAGSFPFGVKVVPAPDYEVTVEARDAQKQTPIKGAHVLLHPYRALTDENGVAKVKVVKGTYKLFVSGFAYVAYQNTIDVVDDVTTQAELTLAPTEDEEEEERYG